MLTNKDLAKYLKYGWVSDYNYPDPKPRTTMEYEDLVFVLEEMCKDSIDDLEVENPLCLLSGGVDSSLVLSQIPNAKTFAISNWNYLDLPWAKKVSDIFSTEHHEFETQGEFLEEDLIKIQSWFDKPYSLLLGFFWFLTCKTLVSHGYYEFIDGNGPDHSMMEDHDNAIIGHASFIGQYEFTKAQLYLINSCLTDINESSRVMLQMLKREHIIDKYLDVLPMNQFRVIFDDNDVKDFGLEPFEIELREESIGHIDELLFAIKEESANLFYQMIEDTLGCKGHHPLRRKDILDLCMETPYEVKNALGFQKLPYRDICSKWVNCEIASRPKLDWKPVIPNRENWMIGDYDFNYPISLEPFRKMLEKYITPKDRKIYNYLDYDLVKSYCENQPPGITKFSRQIWNLLNLSIWLEVHDD